MRRLSSVLRLLSSSLTVASSSLLAWISSLEVSSSSLMLCSSSLADCTSSLADCSSSFAASCCSITDCRYSRVADSSRASRAVSGSAAGGSSDVGAPSEVTGCNPRAWLASSKRTRKPPSSSPPPVTGTTSTASSCQPPSDLTRKPSSLTGACSLPARRMAARTPATSPSRSIFIRSRLALPGAGARYGPVSPRYCRISSSAETSTLGGANFARWRSASR